MRVFDFLFVYEIKNRELESICLLKYELERRGYTVKIVETWQYNFLPFRPINAKVCVTFALYDNGQIAYMNRFTYRLEKLVNLQWEQIFTNAEEYDLMITHAVKDEAKHGVHLCWGEKTVERLINLYKVPAKNVRLTGHIANDFYHPALRGYFLPPDKLLEMHGIKKDLKIVLFISSFAYIGMPDSMLDNPLYRDCGFDPFELRDLSEKTQAKLLEWFERFLKNHNDFVVVYRPHPAEIGNAKLFEMQSEVPGFYVISDCSVKQWILVADKISTWISTSIAEVYAASKGCSVLRPYPIPFSADIPLYNNARFITDYESFAGSVISNTEDWSVPKLDIRKFYHVDDTNPSYILACDVLEEVIQSDGYCNQSFQNIGYHHSTKKKHGLVSLVISASNCVIMLLLRFNLIQRLLSNHQGRRAADLRERVFSIKMAKKNNTSDREIFDIQTKISTIITRNTLRCEE